MMRPGVAPRDRAGSRGRRHSRGEGRTVFETRICTGRGTGIARKERADGGPWRARGARHGVSMPGVALALALASGLGLAGCGDATEEETPAAVAPAQEPGGVVIRDEASGVEVAVEEAGTGLPEDFPSDEVPLPAGGTVVAYVANDEDGARSFTLTVQVENAGEAAAAHRAALEQAGYRLSEEFSASGDEGSFASYNARSADWDVSVLAASEPEGTGDTLVIAVADPSLSGLDAGDPGSE